MQSFTEKFAPFAFPILLIFVAVLLYLLREVMVPITLAVFFAILLSPIDKTLLRHVKHGLSALLLIVLSLAILLMVAWVITGQVRDFGNNVPAFKENIKQRIQSIQQNGRTSALAKTRSTVEQAISEATTTNSKSSFPVPVTVENEKTKSLMKMVMPTMNSAIDVVLIAILVGFFLIERDEIKERIVELIGGKSQANTTKMLNEIGDLLRRYFVAQAAVNAAVAIVIGTALLVLGVKYALLWILTIGLLRFIPYLGIWIAATLAFAVSVATTSSWTQPVATVAVFIVFEPLVGMILEPIVFGKTIGVSKSGMLLSITFWAWLWGPLGMLLATPITASLVIIAKHTPDLGFIVTLLAERKEK